MKRIVFIAEARIGEAEFCYGQLPQEEPMVARFICSVYRDMISALCRAALQQGMDKADLTITFGLVTENA
jgi:hypothetical protein